MNRKSLVLAAVVLAIMILPEVLGAEHMGAPNAYAQYAGYDQYSAVPQYAPGGQYPTDGQYGEATPSCAQDALNNLGGSSPARNAKLLVQYVKCGGTLASLPQNVINTLKAQNVIYFRIINGATYACPNGGDQSYCSAL